MPEPFLLRTAAPADFDRWLPLWDGYNAFYGRAGPTALPRHVTETSWRRFFDEEEPMHALVAEAGGELLGFAHYLFHRSTTAIAPSCYLRDLFTAGPARGRGIATALLDRVCEEAASAGSESVYWQTHEDNRAARRLYDRVGQRTRFIIYAKPV